jgi:hypothetical protein
MNHATAMLTSNPMIQIRLLSGRVHLRRITPGLLTEAGLHLVERYADDAMCYHILGIGPNVDSEIQPGLNCLIPHLQDSVTLDDGTMVAKADQIHAVWGNDEKEAGAI